MTTIKCRTRSLASQWRPGLYSHEKPPPSGLMLIRFPERWLCCDCGRFSRLCRMWSPGFAECARCRSRFITPENELPKGELAMLQWHRDFKKTLKLNPARLP